MCQEAGKLQDALGDWFHSSYISVMGTWYYVNPAGKEKHETSFREPLPQGTRVRKAECLLESQKLSAGMEIICLTLLHVDYELQLFISSPCERLSLMQLMAISILVRQDIV